MGLPPSAAQIGREEERLIGLWRLRGACMEPRLNAACPAGKDALLLAHDKRRISGSLVGAPIAAVGLDPAIPLDTSVRV